MGRVPWSAVSTTQTGLSRFPKVVLILVCEPFILIVFLRDPGFLDSCSEENWNNACLHISNHCEVVVSVMIW